MFKFLKDKLKGAVSKFSKKVEEASDESVEETKEDIPQEPAVEEKEVVEEPTAETKTEKESEEAIEKKLVSDELEDVEKPGEIIEEPKDEEVDELLKDAEKESSQVEIRDIPEEKEDVSVNELLEDAAEESKEVEEKEEVVSELEEDKIEIEKPEETKEEVIEPVKEEIDKESLSEELKEEIKKEEEKEVIEEPEEVVEEEKKGFFSKLTQKITTTKINETKFETLFEDLEMAMLENNVAFEVIEKIKYDLKGVIVDTPIKRNKIEDTIKDSLKNSIESLFDVEKIDLLEKIRNKEEKPFIISFIGINGSGKTTSIAKVANMLKNNKFSCVLAASDTFRAASIEQLEYHGKKLGIKVIKHDYQSDPAAVAFDAIKHAKAKEIDVVLIDTAGRLHSNSNLIEEMKKIIRISKPDLKIFVGESITGNDCIEQAKAFNDAVGIDGIILTKADVDEKGGAAISVSYVTKSPIMYFGVGQEYIDLKEFDSNMVVEGLGL